jgi:hypothetical protein
MKKISCIIVLLIVSFSAFSQDKIVVYEDDDQRISVFKSTIKGTRSKAYVWTEVEYIGEEHRKKQINGLLKIQYKYNQDVDLDKWMNLYSTKYYDVIDCNQNIYADLSTVHYTRNGEVVYHFTLKEPPKSEWFNVVPGSMMESIVEYICEH